MHDFFFQAEDGIRDLTVTGVQTCALPISRKVIDDAAEGDWSPDGRRIVFVRIAAEGGRTRSLLGIAAARSEERRVGKECRSRRWPELYRKEGERCAVSGSKARSAGTSCVG